MIVESSTKSGRSPAGLVDWHCHILPGIDDGAENLAEALEIANILTQIGYAEVYCTPHCLSGLYDNTPTVVRRAVSELQRAIEAVGIPLRLHLGMEYFLDEFFIDRLSDPLPLGDSGYLLVEANSQADPEQIKNYLFAVRRRGLTPLIAHPERYKFLAPQLIRAKQAFSTRIKGLFSDSDHVKHAFDQMDNFKNLGCSFQCNIGSFSGIYGSETAQQAALFFDSDYYCCFGTDTHRAKNLKRILQKGFTSVGIPLERTTWPVDSTYAGEYLSR